MRQAFVSCYMEGDNFDPYKLEEKLGLSLAYKVKAGEIGKKGRFKDKPYPFGFGYLKPTSKEAHENNQLEEIVNLIKESHIQVGAYGIEDLHVRVNINYDSQCNLEFGPLVLEELGRRNIPLLVSCYKVEEGDI